MPPNRPASGHIAPALTTTFPTLTAASLAGFRPARIPRPRRRAPGRSATTHQALAQCTRTAHRQQEETR